MEINKGELFTLATAIDYSAGAVISKEIVHNSAGSLSLFAFDKGQGLSTHSAPFDATVYVTDGKATVTIDGKPHHLTTGEMIVMPANIPHALFADERFKMLLIMIKGQ